MTNTSNRASAAVLFDLDGTLLDTAPDFARTLNGMLTDRGLEPLPYAQIRATVSNGARALVTLAFDIEEGASGFEPLRQELLSRYEVGLAVETAPFPGIRALLAELAGHGRSWGIVTNKPSRYTDPLLGRMRFHPRPAAVICPDHVSQTKPDPEPLLLACRQIGIEASSCLYVGDHARDIEAGRRAGMQTVAVRWGYINDEERIEDWAADHNVDTVAELSALISDCSWTGRAP